MSWGNDLLLAAGDTARLSSGWGDYTGTVRKHNSPTPIAWTAGNYCHYNAIPWTSTYIAEIIKLGTTEIQSTLSSLGSLKVFPNPTNTHFKVNFNGKIDIKVKVFLYDILGHPINLIYQGSPEQLHTQVFSVQNYAKGMYLIYITDESNHVINYEKITIY